MHGGITPAYAGKSGAPAISPVMMTDHPRLCGEKSSPFCAPCAIRGSPPPMRGKVLLLHILSGHLGITPAYAGKSFAYAEAFAVAEDHPRLCGEKAVFRFSVEICLGSPPPMRGKVLSQCFLVGVLRITPAYAGKSTQL